MEEKDIAVFNLADSKKIKCMMCKYGQNGCLLSYCAKFKEKPHDVYFENADCPEFVEVSLDDLD